MTTFPSSRNCGVEDVIYQPENPGSAPASNSAATCSETRYSSHIKAVINAGHHYNRQISSRNEEETERAIYSLWYGRFAADLLLDCREMLLQIADKLDGDMKKAEKLVRMQRRTINLQQARHERIRINNERVRATAARADRAQLIAGAAFARWISNQIVYEVCRIETAQYADNLHVADDNNCLTLLQSQTNSPGGTAQAADPPRFPEPLKVRWCAQLDLVRQMLDGADRVIMRNTSDTMQILHQYTSALSAWVAVGH